MTRAGRIDDRIRGVGLLLATLALLVRLAFPTGFMLSPERASLPTLVICTGQGAMTVAIDAQGQAHEVKGDAGEAKGGQDHKSDGKTTHPCTFAAATAVVVAPVLIATLAPVALGQVLDAPLMTTQRPGLGLAAPPPPTTGPPARI